MLAKTKLSIPAARWIRIVSPTIVVYIIAYMDRMNISFAIAGGMNKSLALSPTSAGMAAGVFFFGYMFLQAPPVTSTSMAAREDTSFGQFLPGEGWLTALPYLTAVGSLYLFGAWNDTTRNPKLCNVSRSIPAPILRERYARVPRTQFWNLGDMSECADLVDKEKWADLTERAYRKFLRRHGAARHEMLVVRVQFAEVSRLFANQMTKPTV